MTATACAFPATALNSSSARVRAARRPLCPALPQSKSPHAVIHAARPRDAVILSGVTVRSDQVQLLARLVKGDLAAKLALALKNRNDLVALSSDDRHLIVAVLNPPPFGLIELREVLVRQLRQAKEREARAERSREAERMREAWSIPKRQSEDG